MRITTGCVCAFEGKFAQGWGLRSFWRYVRNPGCGGRYRGRNSRGRLGGSNDRCGLYLVCNFNRNIAAIRLPVVNEVRGPSAPATTTYATPSVGSPSRSTHLQLWWWWLLRRETVHAVHSIHHSHVWKPGTSGVHTIRELRRVDHPHSTGHLSHESHLIHHHLLQHHRVTHCSSGHSIHVHRTHTVGKIGGSHSIKSRLLGIFEAWTYTSGTNPIQ